MQADAAQAFSDYAANFPEAHADEVGGEIDKRDVEGRERRRGEQLAAMWQVYEQHVSEGSLLQAGGALEALSDLAPDDPRLDAERSNLAARKTARADELVTEGRQLIRAKDYAKAMEVLAQAEELVPDHANAQKYVARARSKEVKRLLDEAKSLTRSGEYGVASELIERAALLDPNERGVEKARQQVEKRAGAGAAKQARDQARNAAKAEKDRIAAERDSEKDRVAAERKADKDRAAAEREEKVKDRKRGDHKLEFRVDASYADDNLTARMRYPQECTAKPRTKRLSKDAMGTELHLVRTVEVKCGEFGFGIVQDKAEISVTCENRTCDECTETVDWIVEPAAAQIRRDGKKLKKVKSCR